MFKEIVGVCFGIAVIASIRPRKRKRAAKPENPELTPQQMWYLRKAAAFGVLYGRGFAPGESISGRATSHRSNVVDVLKSPMGTEQERARMHRVTNMVVQADYADQEMRVLATLHPIPKAMFESVTSNHFGKSDPPQICR